MEPAMEWNEEQLSTISNYTATELKSELADQLLYIQSTNGMGHRTDLAYRTTSNYWQELKCELATDSFITTQQEARTCTYM